MNYLYNSRIVSDVQADKYTYQYIVSDMRADKYTLTLYQYIVSDGQAGKYTLTLLASNCVKGRRHEVCIQVGDKASKTMWWWLYSWDWVQWSNGRFMVILYVNHAHLSAPDFFTPHITCHMTHCAGNIPFDSWHDQCLNAFRWSNLLIITM